MKKLIIVASALVISLSDWSLIGIKEVNADILKDAAYCRRAGDWAVAELIKRIEDNDRSLIDAVEEFGEDQNAAKAYFIVFAKDIYERDFKHITESREVGLNDMADKLVDLEMKFQRKAVSDFCITNMMEY